MTDLLEKNNTTTDPAVDKEYLNKIAPEYGLDETISDKVKLMVVKKHIECQSANYFLDGLLEKRNTIKSYIETGFKNFDKEMDGGLFPGLYVLGAISSMGKTSFILQMADQIAADKHCVLYFSLEMGTHELIAKSLSRYTYLISNKNFKDSITARRINSNYVLDNFQQLNFDNAVKLYKDDVAENIFYFEGLNDIGVDDIRKEIERQINIKKTSPIVFIDYLQIIKPINENWTEKRNIDKIVIELRKIARDYNIPIIAISSLNRGSYKGDIDLDAFKESGAIEYGSDVLLGLQPPNLESGLTPKEAKSNREAIESEKRKAERKIELKILKNRSGRTGQRIPFEYNAMFNYFEETDDDGPAWEDITSNNIPF